MKLKSYSNNPQQAKLPCADAGPKKPEEKAEDEESVSPTEIEDEENDSSGEMCADSDVDMTKESPVLDEKITGPVSTNPDQIDTLPMEEQVESFWRLDGNFADHYEEDEEEEEEEEEVQTEEKKEEKKSPVEAKEEEQLKAETGRKKRMAAAKSEEGADKTEAATSQTAERLKKTQDKDTKQRQSEGENVKEQEMRPEPAKVESKQSKRKNDDGNLTSKGLEEVQAPYVEDLVSDDDKAEQEETRGAFKDCHGIG